MRRGEGDASESVINALFALLRAVTVLLGGVLGSSCAIIKWSGMEESMTDKSR